MEIGMDELEHLREAVEQKAGRRMTVHGDYEYLAGLIFEALHMQISPTTLKRLWGKLDEAVVPRRSTIDILAQFVGAEDWTNFCKRLESETPEGETQAVHRGTARLWYAVFGGLGVALLALLLWLFHPWNGETQADDERFILRQGQAFDSFADYLRLFGLTEGDSPWYRPVPHHPVLCLWGPRYHHPEWHNDGNPDSLMPTITEYWEPLDSLGVGDKEMLVRRMNSDAYFVARRLNEVRLTFMSNLPADTAHFVFLGVYRLSLSQSDTTCLVWERVANEADLRRLDFLENFRN